MVFEADVPPYGIIGDDTLLAKRKEELNQVAADNGLTSLDAFESYDPAGTAEFLRRRVGGIAEPSSGSSRPTA